MTITFSTGILRATTGTGEIKSVEITSPDWDNTTPAPGSWKITKSAEWVGANTAEIKFDVTSTIKLVDEPKDIILVLDTSESMLTEKNGQSKLAKMKADATELAQKVLDSGTNRIALVEFNTTATVLSTFTNSKDSIVDKISKLNGYGATNYRDALEKAAMF